MGNPYPATTALKTVNSLPAMNLVILVRGATTTAAEWAEKDPHGGPYLATNLPIYFDPIKAVAQDPAAFNLANAPGQGKQVFIPFSTLMVNPSTPADSVMFGYIEALNK